MTVTAPPPSETIIYKLGELVYNWNRLEYYSQSILHTLFDGAHNIHILISGLGNVGVKEAIDVFAKETMPADEASYFTHFADFFDILRIKRNWIIHGSRSIKTEDGEESLLLWEIKARSRITISHETYNPSHIQSVIDDISRCIEYADAIREARWNRFQFDADSVAAYLQRLALIEKPPLPDKIQKPFQLLIDKVRPPPPFRA